MDERRMLSRKEWTLIAFGFAAWVAIGSGGLWLLHQLARPQEACAGAADAPTRQVKGASASPRNAFQAITGQGLCK